jgi:predicted Fe-Mo cluster-binding NifX family protein
MKQIIAIPTSNSCLCQHFGHCEKFALFEVENNSITNEKYLDPPHHEPGVLPAWLALEGATHIIAGGIGQRAISLFKQQNIQVIAGVIEKPARELAEDFLANNLIAGTNACNH